MSSRSLDLTEAHIISSTPVLQKANQTYWKHVEGLGLNSWRLCTTNTSAMYDESKEMDYNYCEAWIKLNDRAANCIYEKEYHDWDCVCVVNRFKNLKTMDGCIDELCKLYNTTDKAE